MNRHKRLFGRFREPVIPFGLADFPAQVIKTEARMSLSGVQMKLSVRVHPETWILETVAVGGTHILKPEPSQFPELPQNENLCMNIAEAVGMAVPPHGLLTMADGTWCYLVKRFDRLDDGTKLQKETLFQILGAEDKYQGSLEQVGKIIRLHATHMGLETLAFFERVVVCFLIGNGDMHLKNWALLTNLGGTIALAPCYDFVCSNLYLPGEGDSALSLNGKKHKLSRTDFDALAVSLHLDAKAARHVFRKLAEAKARVLDLCRSSELSAPLRKKLMEVIESRYRRLYT